MKNQFIFDESRQMVRGRLFELRQDGKKHPPLVNLCTYEEFEFRPDGRRRSERERQNLLMRLYPEKLAQLREKRQRREAEQRKQEVGPPIWEAMQQWLDGEIGPYSRANTLTEYRRTCTLYLEAGGNHPIREFRKHHATQFQTSLQQRDLSEAGIRKHQTQLQIFLNWAYSEEHLNKPVRLTKTKVTQQGPVIYSQEEVRALQAAIEGALQAAPTPYQKRCLSNHLRAFMAARHAVLRCGEVLAMPLRHVLVDEGMLRIATVRELDWHPKTRQERIVPMNPELRRFLQEDIQAREAQEKWLLDDGTGRRAYATNSQLTQVFRRYVKRCGLEQERRKPLHALRSTGITAMLSAGGKLDFVMRIAGHSNPQTTLNHYVRAENFDLRDTVKLLSHPPKNGASLAR